MRVFALDTFYNKSRTMIASSKSKKVSTASASLFLFKNHKFLMNKTRHPLKLKWYKISVFFYPKQNASRINIKFSVSKYCIPWIIQESFNDSFIIRFLAKTLLICRLYMYTFYIFFLYIWRITEKKALKKEYSQKSDKKSRHFWNLDISKMSRLRFLRFFWSDFFAFFAFFFHLLGNFNKKYKKTCRALM